jgi:DNA-binding transcriptional MerR regulator
MKNLLFTPSDVSAILGIPLRRITNFAEKGLIVPAREAAGAGSKRLYGYINILEFALVEELFRLGLGIHLIKKILHDLRIDKTLQLWAEDYDAFFSKIARKYKEAAKALAAAYPEEASQFLKYWDSEVDIKKNTKNYISNGTLFYFSNVRGGSQTEIVPVHIKLAFGVPSLVEDISKNESGIFVNIGQIKRKADRRIELNFGEGILKGK